MTNVRFEVQDLGGDCIVRLDISFLITRYSWYIDVLTWHQEQRKGRVQQQLGRLLGEKATTFGVSERKHQG